MQVSIPDKLKALNVFLPRIYIVGGYVRNALLGIGETDIDMCGEYTPDEVFLRLKGTFFKAVEVNKRLGTLKIYDTNDTSFEIEYTTFRRDSYLQGSGAHSPEEVKFTRSIKEDAFRRDFKVNSLYLDVATAEIMDFTGGLADLEKKQLSTCRAPIDVFSEDGLRLLRLVRQAAELDFKIEDETFSTAKSLVGLLSDISAERIREEFFKIIVADTRYKKLDNKSAHVRGLRLLDEIGALKYILPELLDGKGFKQDTKHHIYDIFEHNLHTYEVCPPKLRLAGLVHDIGKPASIKKYDNMYFHAELGASIVSSRLGKNGLKLPNKEIDRLKRLILGHMYDLSGDASEKKVRMFIIKNLDIIDDLIVLKRADAVASKGMQVNSVSADKLERLYKTMQNDKTPFTPRELGIDGSDLIELEINPKDRNWALQKVFERAVCDEKCRSRDEQLDYLKGLRKNGDD
ncbi:MAG: HD domain-containing protein [Clostridia bacterium]